MMVVLLSIEYKTTIIMRDVAFLIGIISITVTPKLF